MKISVSKARGYIVKIVVIARWISRLLHNRLVVSREQLYYCTFITGIDIRKYAGRHHMPFPLSPHMHFCILLGLDTPDCTYRSMRDEKLNETKPRPVRVTTKACRTELTLTPRAYNINSLPRGATRYR